MRRRWIALGLTVIAAVAALAWSGVGATAQTSVPNKQDQAQALADAPAAAQPGATFAGRDARAEADRRAASIPLPTGGTFSGIRWEQLDAVESSTIDGTLQYNAACQWLRALRDGRDAVTARGVLADIPRWPAFRGADGVLVAAIGQSLGGGGSTADGVLADCDATHQREVRYAQSIGLTPSS